MMAVRQTDGLEEAPAPLPPESAAAHFEAIAKGINDVDVVIQGLIGRIRPAKPWQRQLLQQLRTADRHVEILRLAISLDRSAEEILEAAKALKQGLQLTNMQIVGGRADGFTRNALLVAFRNATLVTEMLSP
ncbi:hypothetical protein [Roseateles puraquae]|uniref:Uncharacterized protein n=1 Tax=Roseateles puraquae TaxID=431059 RepID=A0A254N1G2_9BURK|nr:hypothetical protein [Roseateles puraquae]MDG0857338.1 hypothetical protein [Roseateles puraquae]OWR02079.1 hypothetical protein CDO81_20250 [Roseateles puraquae]RTL33514.1 MAG: hypothetical protein EKK53_27955 [Burkholderiales bacterium]